MKPLGVVRLTIVANFDYHNTVTIGETSVLIIVILLLLRVLHHDASLHYHHLLGLISHQT